MKLRNILFWFAITLGAVTLFRYLISGLVFILQYIFSL